MTARKTPMKRIALTNSSYRMGFTTSALPPNRSLSSSEEVNTTTGIIFKLSVACRAEGFAKAGVSLPQGFETVHQGQLQVQQNQDQLAGPKALRRPAVPSWATTASWGKSCPASLPRRRLREGGRVTINSVLIGSSSTIRTRFLWRISHLRWFRQREIECGASIERALGPGPATVPLNDAPHVGQADAGAFELGAV